MSKLVGIETPGGIAPGRGLSVACWIIQILAAAAFLAAGAAKLSGQPMMVAIFDHVGIGQWFRYVTGAVEVVGAVALLVPRLAAFGALLLAATMACAIGVHLLVIGGNPAPACLLLAMTGAVVWIRRRSLSRAR